MILVSFSHWLLEKVGEHAFAKIAGSIETKEIDKKFKKAILTTSKELQKKYPDILGGSIDTFFEGHEIYNNLFKLLFKDSIIDINSIKEVLDTSTLPENFIFEFINLLKSNCSNDRMLNEILSNNKLFISVIGISEDTDKIAKVSTLSFKEIKEIRELLEKKFNEQFQIQDFFSKYSKSAIKVLSELNFLGLGVKSHIKKNRKKLNDVYVEPKFIIDEENTESTPTYFGNDFLLNNSKNSVPLADIFNKNTNLVILGNPGSGKSVLVRYVICNILENNCHLDFNNKDINERIPFRIELRKYFQYKKNTTNGIIKYFIKSLESDYGLLNLTEKNIDTLLNQSKILFFLTA